MKPAEGNQRIGIPAYFTSHAWVEAGFDYADLFETKQGRLMFKALEPVMRLFGFLGPAVRLHNEYLFVRHFAHEARLRQIRPSCIVEIGAGLSPRGIAFASADPDLRYIEVDLPNMVAAKRSALGDFQDAPELLPRNDGSARRRFHRLPACNAEAGGSCGGRYGRGHRLLQHAGEAQGLREHLLPAPRPWRRTLSTRYLRP